MIRPLLSLLAACLTGCASDSPVQAPRYYVDYRAVLIEKIDHAFMGGPYASAPGPVKFAYEACGADFILSGLTENERARLDAYARREITLTSGELRDLDRRIRSRLGDDLTYETLDRLNSICPDKVPLFRQHFQ